VKANLDFAERLATFADANRHSRKVANLSRKQALDTYAKVKQAIANPGWTGMDRQALETRFARLHSLLVDLNFCEPGIDIGMCPPLAHLPTRIEKHQTKASVKMAPPRNG